MPRPADTRTHAAPELRAEAIDRVAGVLDMAFVDAAAGPPNVQHWRERVVKAIAPVFETSITELEAALANANARIAARDRAGLSAVFLADAIGLDGVEAEAEAAREAVIAPLRVERDAALRLAQEANHDCRRWAGLLQEAKAERDAALAGIEKAPHADDCAKRDSAGHMLVQPTACTCWKSTVDTSALVKRDADIRTADDVRCRECRSVGLHRFDCSLRALAEGGENRG